MFRDTLTLALKNALRNRRRTLLTVASISISLFLLGVLLSVYHAFYHQEAPPEQALRLITRNRVSLTFSLPEYYEQQIRRVPGVRAVGSSSWFGGIYIDNRPENFFPRFAIEPDRIFEVYKEFTVPPEQLEAFRSERTAAAVGRTLAERLNFKLGQRITIEGDIYPVDLELTIRAIFDSDVENQDFAMYFHRKYLEEGLPQARRGMVGTFCILADSAEAVPRIARQVDELYRNSERQTKTETERAFQLSFVSMLGNVKVFLLSICGALVFTILLVSANTMGMSVRERITEIGVLRTLGFTSGRVLAIIVAEAVLISFAGGLVGCGLAWGASGMLRQSQLMLSGLSFSPPVFLISLTVALAIGILSSLVPALGATRLPITSALRHTG